jgi:hypothetical protein
MATQIKDAAWLEWIAGLMGAGSRQTITATLPPGRFYCLLDELPLHLVSRRQLELQSCSQDMFRQPLFLNPQCSILPNGQVPEELDERRNLLDGFHLQGTIAWVRDPITTALLPFWLGPRLEAIVPRIHSGKVAPASLPTHDRWLLAQAGILTTEDYARRSGRKSPRTVLLSFETKATFRSAV